MTTIDYSVWDHIEVSDDEDDTHPNIDTPSLFRWRHQARVERMEAFQKKGAELEKSLLEAKRKLSEAQRRARVERMEAFQKKGAELEKSLLEAKRKLSEAQRREAKYHMKRCIDSGLWVPNSRTDDDGEKEEEKEEEPQYEELKTGAAHFFQGFLFIRRHAEVSFQHPVSVRFEVKPTQECNEHPYSVQVLETATAPSGGSLELLEDLA
ncbi:hypothetical protein PGIGA_G00164980 [Pangasianodon gigas]|uniref:Uncharacterized protein n=1 Tax=Pangasianodon gigas TaxID=30993 RepID=A0ACC5XS58_PANGG|nr:hypothetical protein [Pangasianodon gigas]